MGIEPMFQQWKRCVLPLDEGKIKKMSLAGIEPTIPCYEQEVLPLN